MNAEKPEAFGKSGARLPPAACRQDSRLISGVSRVELRRSRFRFESSSTLVFEFSRALERIRVEDFKFK